jgi:hypothetical protein
MPRPETVACDAKEKPALVAHTKIAVDELVHRHIAARVMPPVRTRRKLQDALVEEDGVVVAHHAGMVN